MPIRHCNYTKFYCKNQMHAVVELLHNDYGKGGEQLLIQTLFGLAAMALLLAALVCLVLAAYHFCRWAKFEADVERHRLREKELRQELGAMKRSVNIECYANYRDCGAQDRNPK